MQNAPQPSQQSAQGTPPQPSPPIQSSPPQKRFRTFKFFATTGSLLAALAAIVTVLQFLGITNIGTLFQNPTPTPQNPGPISHYIQLKPSYSGNAHGYQNALLRFYNVSQDSQGNVSLALLFTLINGNKQATYSCQGKFTGNQSITLNCTQIDAQDFKLVINASLPSSDHIQGTLEATNSTDPTYDHLYAWSADASGS